MVDSFDSLPTPGSTHEVVMDDGAVVIVRRYGNPSGSLVLVSHGNGLATDGYYPFWKHLLPDYDVLIYDQRNHGRNPLHGSWGHHIRGFVEDLAQLLDYSTTHFGPKATFGAFHSVSAITALNHLNHHPWPWAGLVLFDPPIVPSPDEALFEQARASEYFMGTWAIGRPDSFESVAALADALRFNKGMSGWVEGAHELMARALLRCEDGRWVLSCPRGLESSVYIANGFAPTWDAIPILRAHADRALVLGADPDAKGAKYPALITRRLGELGIDVQALEGTTHMLQIEQPQRCAEIVQQFFVKCVSQRSSQSDR